MKRAPLRRLKYGNRRTTLGARTYDSKGEATRAAELQLLEKAGEIRDLRYQVTFRLDVGGVHITNYRADFVYESKESGRWELVVEDYKGLRTDLYLIKSRLMLAVHGIRVLESGPNNRRRAS